MQVSGSVCLVVSSTLLGGLALPVGAGINSGDPTRGVRLHAIGPSLDTGLTGVTSDGGLVVGVDWPLSPESSTVFLWTPEGGRVDLTGLPDGFDAAEPGGMSRDGAWITGTVWKLADGITESGRAFRWSQATGFELLPKSEDGVTTSRGMGISRDGVVVGMESGERASDDAPGFNPTWPARGFAPEPFSTVTLWGAQTLVIVDQELPDWQQPPRASAISDDGSTITGVLGGPAHDRDAFVWTEADGVRSINPAGDLLSPDAISADGDVVAGWGFDLGNGAPFVWTESEGVGPLGLFSLEVNPAVASVGGMTSDGAVFVGAGVTMGATALRTTAAIWNALGASDDTPRDFNEIVRENYGFDLGDLHLATLSSISDDERAFTGRVDAESGDDEDGFVYYLRLPENPCFGDVTTEGAVPGDASFGAPDGQATLADLTFEVERWISGDPLSDATTIGANPGEIGYGLPDGRVTVEDLTFFVEAWLSGCP